MRLKRFTTRAAALGTAGMCAVAVAILVAACQSQPATMKTSKPQPPQATAAPPPTNGTVAQSDTKNAVTKVAAREPSPVTIVGCLERDAQLFRLNKTAGAGAPKARSWKSGFLKKRAASIEVVDASNRLKLPNQVGHRVSVVGVLVDREMRARSLQRVEGSCED